MVLLIAYWPWVRNHWDRLTGSRTGLDAAVSLDTEYWCPMCPGVLSDWPARCPVCHMDLVRRKKGEPVPLPDGVVARMQFTPYRVQLAGIRTAPAEFRPLAWEATCGGRLEASRSERLEVKVDVPRDGLAAVRPGLTADVECDARSGEKFRGRVQVAGPDVDPQTQTIRVLLTVDDERQELRPGLFVTVRFRVPLTRLDQSDRLAREAWRDRTAAEVALHSLSPFARPPGIESLLDGACHFALHGSGLTLAVPAGAVIDTGDRKLVFVERMAGMFDGLEVTLGRRCGDYYPVLRGLAPGERVVTAGAFLLDAETRLNPAMAAAYFGAAARPPAPSPPTSEDEQLIARQKLCPVTDAPLGSMGAPVKLVVEGRTVLICCKGCEKELRADAKKYLAKVPR
ncbi:MAG TPA: efflux RND transporter periplasmic adaptor subunit [Gemmataceae bacterium]|nr:efflux RND transporter periplasmic adaptor subunit [Gemmataceae bacterium]